MVVNDLIRPQKDFPTSFENRPTAALRLAIAEAVAKPNTQAMLLDVEHNSAGWKSVREAVAGDACYCVVPKDRLLVLDADRDWQPEMVASICERLQAEGLSPVLLASGQRDHQHLFCNVRDRSLLENLRKEAHSAGIDTRSHRGARIRPPFTAHRLGLPSVLLFPSTPDEALEALSTDDNRSDQEPRLTNATWQLVMFGDDDPDGSKITWRIVTGAAAVGYTADKLYSLLKNPRYVGGEGLRRRIQKRGEGWARSWFVTVQVS